MNWDVFGAIFALLRGDALGRKPIIFFGATIIILGTIISVTPFRPHWPLGQFVVVESSLVLVMV